MDKLKIAQVVLLFSFIMMFKYCIPKRTGCNINEENKNIMIQGVSTSNNNLDLWNDNCNSNSNSYFNDKSSTIKFPNTTNISVPKIALPHPGNSYNPRVQDSKNLIDSITSNNSHLLELAKYKDHLKNLRNKRNFATFNK